MNRSIGNQAGPNGHEAPCEGNSRLEGAELGEENRRAGFEYYVFVHDAHRGDPRAAIKDGASRTQPQDEELEFPDAAEQAK